MKNRISLSAHTIIVLALTAIQTLAQSIYEPYTFTTLAGNAAYGYTDGTGSAARFGGPVGVAVDSAGNVYVADASNCTIRKVTSAGVVTTLAGLASQQGSSDGTGSAARFNYPAGVAVDGAGSVYVADQSNHTIRKVSQAGVVTTLAGSSEKVWNGSRLAADGYADGTGSQARFANPYGVAVDSAGNVYVAEWGNHTIRKVTPAGVVTTLAGNASIKNVSGGPAGGYADGTGIAALFSEPLGVAVDSAGNVYVADFFNNAIRKVTPAGVVTTLAGLAGSSGSADGTGSHARFNRPYGVAVDSAGSIYVAEWGNHTVRKVTPAGVVTTLAGNASIKDRFGDLIGGYADGIGSAARFNSPRGVAVDGAGSVYVADDQSVRKVTPAGVVTTLAGLPGGPGNADGIASAARFNQPQGVAVDSAGNLYVADSGNNTIRKVTSAGMVTTLAGLAGGSGSADGTGSDARFNGPAGVAVDSAGNVYVADAGTIRKITAGGVVTTLAGLGGSAAVAVNIADNLYLVFGNSIAKATLVGTTWVVTTLAGVAGSVGSEDGTGSAARFGRCTWYCNGLGCGCREPAGVAVAADSVGNVYVADFFNDTIRKVTLAGVVTTLAGLAGSSGSADGTGRDARFNRPYGVAVDRAGNVYVADTGNNTIRKVTPEGVVTTLAGFPGNEASVDGTGSAVGFHTPSDVAVDSAGNIYVADTYNNTIRKGYAEPVVGVTLFGTSGAGFFTNSGRFSFDLIGPAGKLAVVEASKDFVNWLPVWTNTFAGALHFSDPQSGISSNRFYRARLP